MKTKNMTTLPRGNSINRSPLHYRFLLIMVALACFALSPIARAVLPAPDGGYPGQNTAEGDNALFSLTTGINNTATGFKALYSDTAGSNNTATGYEALFSNTTGNDNTANGWWALFSNTTGDVNTANGFAALFYNTVGGANTATGYEALFSNTIGGANTATGYEALYGNTTGSYNTAIGPEALYDNTTGSYNTAIGPEALECNTTGHDNTANGDSALPNNTTGSFNIALGNLAGYYLTTGNYNIDIGFFVGGAAGEANTIRIGNHNQSATFIAGISGVTVAGGVGVIIDPKGHLGTVVSSERFKEAIKPMDKASEAILQLKPVTFRYKRELDPDDIPQFGLVAEEVAKVDPDLVARDAKGEPYTVRYEAVNAMLLNEFLKEHRKVQEQDRKVQEQERKAQEQERTITQLKSTVAQQQKGMEVLAAILKEQASQIQKVSAQLELTKPATKTVVNAN